MRTTDKDILLEILVRSEIQQIPHWIRITKWTVAAAQDMKA